MTGEEIYLDLISKRDFSGSDQDSYIQDLITLRDQAFLHDELPAFYDLLKKANDSGKKLEFKDQPDIFYSDMFMKDVILV